MIKYDKIFVPTNDNYFDFIIMHKEINISTQEQIPIKQLSNVIVLTEDELIQLFEDFLDAREETREFLKLKGLT